MTSSRTKHVHFFPWAYAPFGVICRVTQAQYDGDRDAVILPDRHLVEADEPFDVLTLELELEVPQEVVASVLAPQDTSPLAVVLAFRCADTRWREGVTFPWRGQVLRHRQRLHRAQLSGSIELAASLVRLEEARPSRAGFASRPLARLSEARSWEVRVDRKRPLGGVYLDVRLTSFAVDALVPQSDKANLYRLELEGEAPILWLNSDHPAATAALSSNAQSGRAARLREVAFDVIAPSVWTQLFLRAATDLVEDGTGAEWQEAVVAQVCRLLYGEVLSPEETKARLEDELEALPGLLSKLDAALQRHHELARHLERLAEEEGR